MSPQTTDYEKLLPPGQVARMLRVNPKTVTRWAINGQISCVVLPSGHRRYRESEVLAFLARSGAPTPRREGRS